VPQSDSPRQGGTRQTDTFLEARGHARAHPPERTPFVRFRAELVRLKLDRALFAAVTSQLDSRGVVVRTGS